jgi:hypothetical protein
VRQEPRRTRRPIAHDVHGDSTVTYQLHLLAPRERCELAHPMNGGEELELVDTRALLRGVEEPTCGYLAIPHRSPATHACVREDCSGWRRPDLATNVMVGA